MIKAKNGKVTIKANNLSVVLAEFTLIGKSIMKMLTEEEGMTKEDASRIMKVSTDLAMIDDKKEMDDYMAKTLKKAIDMLFEREDEDHE